MQHQASFVGYFVFICILWSVSVNVAQASNQVDIIVEAETFVPGFYRGRAEPTSGNALRLIAIPHNADPNSFTYRWSVSGTHLSQTSQLARMIAPIGRDMTVSVSVIDRNGQLWAGQSEIIAMAKPELIFYEENILRGNKAVALDKNYTLVGEETTIHAEPFFFGSRLASGLQAFWKVNRVSIPYEDNWQKLNLRRPEDTTKEYRLDLEVRNINNLGETAKQSLKLNFGL